MTSASPQIVVPDRRLWTPPPVERAGLHEMPPIECAPTGGAAALPGVIAGAQSGALTVDDVAWAARWKSTNLTTDGSGNVSQWDDLSGNGHHLTQASAGKRPALVSNVLNGKPVVRSDGSDDILFHTNNDPIPPGSTDHIHVISVMSSNNNGGSSKAFVWNRNLSGVTLGYSIMKASGLDNPTSCVVRDADDDLVNANGFGNAFDDGTIRAMRWSYIDSAGRAEVWANGDQKTTDTNASVSGGSKAASAAFTLFGRHDEDSGRFTATDTAEVFILFGDLTQEIQDALVSHTNSEYGYSLTGI